MSSFLSDAKARLQHNNMLSLAPKDIKNLAEIISTEKAVINTSTRLSNDYRKAADALKEWGMGEGDDLADVLSKLAILFGHLADAQGRFSDHDGTYRIHFKSVRMREENLTALKKSKETVQSKIVSLEKKITKMSSENKDLPTLTTRLQELKSELVSLEQSVSSEEARLSDFKRDTVRDGLGLRLGAMLELAEKMTIICELGKMLVAEVPMDRTAAGDVRAPYHGAAKTQSILEEAQRCLTEVIFNPHPGGIITNEVGASENPSSPEVDRPLTAPHFPSSSMHNEHPTLGFQGGADQKYSNDGNFLPSYQAESHPDQTAYSTFDPNNPLSSPLPYAQQSAPPSKRAYSPPPQVELNYNNSRTFLPASGPGDADSITAAPILPPKPYDDSFHMRGSDGVPRSTGPGEIPTDLRPGPAETNYGAESSETLPTHATRSHESNSEPRPSSRAPIHRPSNPSISGSASGWQEPPRTTNAGAFRRGSPSTRAAAQLDYEPPESKAVVQPLNFQKRATKPENAHLPPDRSPRGSMTNSGLPHPPSVGGSSTTGFSQNRYVTNLD